MSISEEEARMEEAMLEAVDTVFNEITSSHLKSQLEEYIVKIEEARDDADSQYTINNFRVSLILYCISLEILIRQIIIKPLAHGAFYYEEWAELLASKIGSGNTGGDRDILPKVLRTIGIDISEISIDSMPLLDCIKKVAELRNKAMHDYVIISKEDTKLASLCVSTMFKSILTKLLNYYHIREVSKHKYEWHYQSGHAKKAGT